MSGLWVRPEFSEGHFTLFAIALAFAVAMQVTVSPQRRRAMGVTRFAAAVALVSAIPLAAVLIVRTAFFNAFEDAGYGFATAVGLSLAWMAAFTFAGRALLRRLPPTSWLMADLKLAGDAGWRDFLTGSPRTGRA
jgi:hypothetical protein